MLKTRFGGAKPRLSLGMAVKPLRRQHKSKLSGSAVTRSSCPLFSTRQLRSARSHRHATREVADHGR